MLPEKEQAAFLEWAKETVTALRPTGHAPQSAYQTQAERKIAMSQELFKYYSTQRPIEPGTYPEPPENELRGILRYRSRTPVEGGAFQAWGELNYAHPLSDRQLYDYELRPSRSNPDVRETMERQAQVIGPWEVYRRVPGEKRVTEYDPSRDAYRPRAGVSPLLMNAQHNSAQKFPVPKPRRKKNAPQQGER